MQISLSELKVNVGHYVDLAETEDVIITKYGKPAAKIIRYEKTPWFAKEIPETLTSFSQLRGTIPDDIDLEEIKTERITRKAAVTPK